MITKWLNEGRATKEALIKAISDMKLHVHHIADNYLNIESHSRTHVQDSFGRFVVYIDTVVYN